MEEQAKTVFVVDDDDAVRDALAMLIRSVSLEVAAFSSASEFLAAYDPAQRGCLVLDIRMPGMSGLELQEQLIARDSVLPVIFVTGHGDVPMAVRAMGRGAFDFLLKPFNDQDLLDRIRQALEVEDGRRQEHELRRSVEERLSRLTPREKEVMALVAHGLTNKAIAGRLGLSQRTVEIHRSKVMEKMEAPSLAHLVRMELLVSSDPAPNLVSPSPNP